jgi:hypothetical protein
MSRSYCVECGGFDGEHAALCPVVLRVQHPLIADESQVQRRHEVRLTVLKEMVRARYDASHHSPDIIASNVATANAYAEALYPEAK